MIRRTDMDAFAARLRVTLHAPVHGENRRRLYDPQHHIPQPDSDWALRATLRAYAAHAEAVPGWGPDPPR
jgi:hypothetical protein